MKMGKIIIKLCDIEIQKQTFSPVQRTYFKKN